MSPPPSLGKVAFYAFVPTALRPTVSAIARRVRGAGVQASVVPLRSDAPPSSRRGAADGSLHRLAANLHASLDSDQGLQSLLRYADLNSMAHSREVRLPFLDHTLVEYVFSLPNHLKIDGGLGKIVLRESMRGVIPEEICDRTDKIGYEPPHRDWLAEEDVMRWVRAGTKNLVADGWLLPSAEDLILDDSPGLWGGPGFRWGIAGHWLQAVDRWRAIASDEIAVQI